MNRPSWLKWPWRKQPALPLVAHIPPETLARLIPLARVQSDLSAETLAVLEALSRNQTEQLLAAQIRPEVFEKLAPLANVEAELAPATLATLDAISKRQTGELLAAQIPLEVLEKLAPLASVQAELAPETLLVLERIARQQTEQWLKAVTLIVDRVHEWQISCDAQLEEHRKEWLLALEALTPASAGVDNETLVEEAVGEEPAETWEYTAASEACGKVTVLKLNGVEGKQHYLCAFNAAYGAPVNGRVTVLDGPQIRDEYKVLSGGRDKSWARPVACPEGKTLKVVLAEHPETTGTLKISGFTR